jgi:hypothetical protein
MSPQPLYTRHRSNAAAAGAAAASGPTLAHPYATNSLWNTPIANQSYTVSPDTVAQVAHAAANDGEFGPTVNSVPSIYNADAGTPRVNVTVNYPTCAASVVSNVPIDPSWLPGNGGEFGGDAEPGMVVRDPNGTEWGMFGVHVPNDNPGYNGCPPVSNWSVGRIESDLWTGSGTGDSTRGSGTLNGAGAIMAEETKLAAGSDMGHMIAMAYSYTRNTHVLPAQYSDGQQSDAASMPMGARFWLPPGYNIETSGLREWQKIILRTIRKYGLCIVDSGAALINEGTASVRSRGQTFAWETDGGWLALPPSAISQFQVIYP